MPKVREKPEGKPPKMDTKAYIIVALLGAFGGSAGTTGFNTTKEPVFTAAQAVEMEKRIVTAMKYTAELHDAKKHRE